VIGYYQPQSGVRPILPAPFGGSMPGSAYGMPSFAVQRPPITDYLPPGMVDGSVLVGAAWQQPAFASAGLSGLGAVSTDAAAQALEDAKRRLLALGNRARVIGTPPFFASAAYEQQWDGVLDSLVSLKEEVRGALANEPEAWSEVVKGVSQVNLAIEKLRQSPNDAFYNAAVAALTLNPILLIDSTKRIIRDIGLNVQDLGTAAGQTYGAGGWLDLGKYAKWIGFGIAALVGLRVVGMVRG